MVEIRMRMVNFLEAFMHLGYRIWGDDFIGYRMFDKAGRELNIEQALVDANFNVNPKVISIFQEEAFPRREGGYDKCEWWR